MQRMRILIAVFALVLAPLSGAAAMATGLATAHHHCDETRHTGDTVDTDHHVPKLDPFTCDQCNVALAVLPVAAVQIAPVKLPAWTELPVISAQTQPQLSLFRPPKV
jgi:hypothetical protein